MIMDSMEYINDTEKLLLHTYNKLPVVMERGQGIYLYDEKGKAYLDFGAGIAVSSLGYGNVRLAEALCNQVNNLLHTSNLYHHTQSLSAAKQILKIAGMDQVFFTNSGTEAIEGALKAARKYGYEKGNGKYEFIAMENSFHGRSMGALSVTGTQQYREPFEPLIPGISFAKFNDIESVKEKVTDKTCGIILEPVQGEGGIYPAKKEFLQSVRDLCSERDILLIFDEIQCGMGRSGSYFAWQHYGVKPDILVMAKAIGSGIPVGAFALTNQVAKNSLKPGDHGTTYGGNPLALCAVLTTIEIVKEENLLSHVKEVGKYLREALEKLKKSTDVIKEIRGIGLMQGIELTIPVSDVIYQAFTKGLLLIAAGNNVIRFVPPLIVTKADVDKMIEVLREIL